MLNESLDGLDLIEKLKGLFSLLFYMKMLKNESISSFHRKSIYLVLI